ncbi:MAG: formylglycine-generating enzyme family protein [Microcoleus sp. PH2017_22_RUC_O_B]|uniref:formylglycine-generating enzyme family protein n=1 Tax=unclassified Microcoleus TaxID=2642155 RepID=UPI001D90EF7E|nr:MULTISPECIES: formylglycine-generating enzyme family protein [unclassified Microcoleus]MCC3528927.1 formylglycine-generating enzyme family protein [Microcoleus sp. PH2017_21_RUC_O_A]MCC3541076.1 formylglycine-generating enzyme family protein [Microcoleus sp. PH2017_22_RUC_O_B]
MTENPNQPREYDAVLGGQSQVPLGAAVLGGIPGVKSRLASPIVEVKITALSEALKYGDAGLDLIIGALRDEAIQVKLAAYSLLKDRNDLKLEPHFPQDYLPTFDFDVITVDAEGKENSRSRHYARFFTEDLGNGIVLEMVYIPGGTFMMGSPETEEDRRDNEIPQHQVTVPAFFAGKYPITQAQWQALFKHKAPWYRGEKCPLIDVSWHDAVTFCDTLSQKTGNKYRLLSEAEWEYACRAKTTTPFHFGDSITFDLVNYGGNSRYVLSPGELSHPETTDVGRFPPNAFGLYDMHGNVWEWCSDSWHENYNGAPTDGSSWDTDTDDFRVQRGGSWGSYVINCRSTYRVRDEAENHGWYIGFRVAVASLSPSS